jgi:hypothetical protein
MPIPPGQPPPYAEEIQESRIGLQTGLDGSFNITRQFRVYTAKPGDMPVVTIETLPSALGGEKVGNAYPRRLTGVAQTTGNFWGDGTFTLYNWTIIDHWPGTNVWVLQANYVPSYIGSMPREAWTFRITSTLDAEKIYTEIPWRDDAGTLIEGRGIGPPRYIPVNPTTETPDFTAISLNPDSPLVYLVLAGGGSNPYAANLPRYQVGADLGVRSAVLTLTKRAVAWNGRAVSQAMTALANRSVNEDMFSVLTIATNSPIVFAPAPDNPFLGSMLFSDFQYEPVVADEGGFPSFQVMMQFKHRAAGWQHSLVHTHKWTDDGTESPIKDRNGNLVRETFHVVNPTSLSAVIGAF